MELRSKANFPNQYQFKDKVIVCKICSQTFVFTAGEQEFYCDRNLAEPKRCPHCRARRRQGAANG